MATYRLHLHLTYYSQGFFNVPVDFDRFVPRGDTAALQLGAGGPRVEATINRRANQNGTARIRARGLGRWFRDNFKPGDVVDVLFMGGDLIILGKPVESTHTLPRQANGDIDGLPDLGSVDQRRPPGSGDHVEPPSDERPPDARSELQRLPDCLPLRANGPKLPYVAPASGSAGSPVGLTSRPPRTGDVHSTLFLVSCVSQKRSVPARAKDLYLSEWFVKARGYVEAAGGRWLILSAEHGLVDPETVLVPYERTLNTMSAAERRQWAERVLDQLRPHLLGVRRIVMLAGERYREFLLPALEATCEVEIPLRGLRIGEQLAWFAQRERERA